jgi:hypothetical protein
VRDRSRELPRRGDFGPSWPVDQVEAQAVRVLGLEGEPQNGIPFNLRVFKIRGDLLQPGKLLT